MFSLNDYTLLKLIVWFSFCLILFLRFYYLAVIKMV